MQEIQSYAAHNLLPNTFTFTGHLSKEKVYDIYRTTHCKLFINTSFSEGRPVSIMEALAFGIPVVASNVGGNPELVKNDYNGILFPLEIDNIKIRDGILSLLTNAELWNIYQTNAFDMFQTKSNSKVNSKKLISLLTNL